MRRIDLKKANVARSNTIRDINRQIVLNYVRERGPISRAEIAHETALQRSTVSLIVEELRVDGLIEEVSGESTGGRPPILLSLRTADAVAIGVDVDHCEGDEKEEQRVDPGRDAAQPVLDLVAEYLAELHAAVSAVCLLPRDMTLKYTSFMSGSTDSNSTPGDESA